MKQCMKLPSSLLSVSSGINCLLKFGLYPSNIDSVSPSLGIDYCSKGRPCSQLSDFSIVLATPLNTCRTKQCSPLQDLHSGSVNEWSITGWLAMLTELEWFNGAFTGTAVYRQSELNTYFQSQEKSKGATSSRPRPYILFQIFKVKKAISGILNAGLKTWREIWIASITKKVILI